MLPEKQVDTRYLYRGRGVTMRVDTVETPSGRRTTREIAEHDDCIAVAVLDEQDNVLLVRQFRYPVGDFLLEVPAGGIDPGESALDAARRELQEEIGYYPQEMEELGGFYAIPGYGTEYLHCFLARKLKPSRLIAEDSESIELVRVPLERIPQLIGSGEIRDAKSIAILHLLQLTRSGASPGSARP